ncbi:tetratricopeptide repeat protein [Sphingomonas sp. ac-8]|uniref:tetratricopeptide repeat protein n=1 Tax=Sphingomonas sp. ac-8 TaxID=3242977 RepID=UPI003A80652F
MRLTTLTAAAALALVSISTSLSGQRPDDQINPRSVDLVQQGEAARAAGQLDRAIGLIETALTVDPRNRQGFIALAEIARARGLPGQSIRLYREALALEPTDLRALRGQGEALVSKGAVTRAQENLAKIRKLCRTQCTDATALAAAIAKGPPVTATAQQSVTPAQPTTPTPAKP